MQWEFDSPRAHHGSVTHLVRRPRCRRGERDSISLRGAKSSDGERRWSGRQSVSKTEGSARTEVRTLSSPPAFAPRRFGPASHRAEARRAKAGARFREAPIRPAGPALRRKRSPFAAGGSIPSASHHAGVAGRSSPGAPLRRRGFDYRHPHHFAEVAQG